MTDPALADWIRSTGVFIKTGPFVVHARSTIPRVIDGIELLYANYPLRRDAPFADFHVAVTQPSGLRRWIRPQVNFEFDGVVPFKPLPVDQALPLFEWGLNWTIATHAHQYLIIHAAAIEKDGFAAILPAPAGSGKSTLCAGLVHRGWRLLSDEMALIDMESGLVMPLARPINLKNASIEVIRDFVAGAVITPPAHDTAKGTVALLKAPADAVTRAAEPAVPAWVIVPKYEAGAPASLEPKSRAETFIELGQNAFNYSVHGARGFRVLAKVMDGCSCFHFRYSRLDDAVATFAALAPPGSR